MKFVKVTVTFIKRLFRKKPQKDATHFAKDAAQEPLEQKTIPLANEPIQETELQLTASEAAENAQKAEANVAETKQRCDDAKRACDEFMKSPQTSESVVRATELTKVFMKAQKAHNDANVAYTKAQQALLPFQVDELRAAVSVLETEIDELHKQCETFRNEYNSLDNSMLSTEKRRSISLKIHMNIEERVKKERELPPIKHKLNEAEIAAGLKFRFNHAPHHEMLIRAALNGGKNMVICSCGTTMCWSIDSSYPPKCCRKSPQCGMIGW